MRPIGSLGFTLRWLALPALFAVACLPGKVAADGAPSPVDAFREALRESSRDDRFEPTGKNLGVALTAYRARLRERAKALVRPGDLRRALELPDWRSAERGPGGIGERRPGGDADREFTIIQHDVRAEMFGRLVRSLRSAFQTGGLAARLAALTVIGDMGVEETGPRSGPVRQDVSRNMTPLTADLVALLAKEKEPAVRAAALRALGKIQPAPSTAAPVLAKALRAEIVEERRAAAAALGHWFTGLRGRGTEGGEVGRQIVPLAGMGLGDKDAAVRRLCLGALRQGTSTLTHLFPGPFSDDLPRSGEALVRLHNDLANHWRALFPLAEALNKEVPALTRALEDSNLEACLSAHSALEDVAVVRQRFRELVASLPPLPKKAKGAKADFKPIFEKLPTVVPQLVDTLAHKEVRVRLASLYVLETLGPDAAPAAAALVKALDDRSPFVRWGAVRALGKMVPAASDKVVPGLVKVLADDSKDVRVTAALALGRYGARAKSAVPGLRKVVKSGDAAMRVLAIQVLAGVGSAAEPAVPDLTTALSDTEPRARAAAAAALSRLGLEDKPSRLALRKALEDADAAVREAASDALLPGEEVPRKGEPKKEKGRRAPR